MLAVNILYHFTLMFQRIFIIQTLKNGLQSLIKAACETSASKQNWKPLPFCSLSSAFSMCLSSAVNNATVIPVNSRIAQVFLKAFIAVKDQKKDKDEKNTTFIVIFSVVDQEKCLNIDNNRTHEEFVEVSDYPISIRARNLNDRKDWRSDRFSLGRVILVGFIRCK